MAPPPPDLEKWRAAARIAAEARELGARLATPGRSRRELAEAIERLIRDGGAQPAFPANLSRNVEAAHFTPGLEDSEELRAGDLLKVDVGAHIDGAIADTATTVEVGGGGRFRHLIQAAHAAVAAGIARVRAGVPVDEVSTAIESAIHARGLKPIRDLTGHSIEPYLLHAGKSIPNISGASTAVLEEGEVVAIEPFVTNGAGRIENGEFGNILRFRGDPTPRAPLLVPMFQRFRTLPFTLRWVDAPGDRDWILKSRRLLQSYPIFLEAGGGHVAQAEHTVLVTERGAEVLTSAPSDGPAGR